MKRITAIAFIQEIAKTANAFDQLETAVSGMSQNELSETLLECGIIPEMFAHDSSEEKLWAKYCDILLSMVLNRLDIQSEVIRLRGNSADVFGRADNYTIVGDAKAFRLSRTAKNQKDFKITALDDWRRSDTYACLVAPLYQYPARSSQIYAQAKQRNITLISYVHLKFLLDFAPTTSLELLWQVAKNLSPTGEANIYWQHIDAKLVELTGQNQASLNAYKALEIAKTKEIGDEGITYWHNVIEGYKLLSYQEAIARLIKAEKIEQKIRTITNAISRDFAL